MRNLRLINSEVDLTAIRRELRNSDLWIDVNARKDRPPTHANSDRIQLRTNIAVEGVHYHDIHETKDLPAWTLLPATRQFVVDFASQTRASIGHVRLARLRAGAEIVPHIDVGEYCAIRDRYHLVIESSHGTQFTAGEETVVMREGEFWWFDNKKIHHVLNLGDQPRVHLVFDLLHRGEVIASSETIAASTVFDGLL